MFQKQELSEEQQRELYMQCEKETLVEMLMEANRLLKATLDERLLPTPESMNQIFVNGEWVTDTTSLPTRDELGEHMDYENEREMERHESYREHEFEKSKG